jgi:hypothetical protein
MVDFFFLVRSVSDNLEPYIHFQLFGSLMAGLKLKSRMTATKWLTWLLRLMDFHVIYLFFTHSTVVSKL